MRIPGPPTRRASSTSVPPLSRTAGRPAASCSGPRPSRSPHMADPVALRLAREHCEKALDSSDSGGRLREDGAPAPLEARRRLSRPRRGRRCRPHVSEHAEAAPHAAGVLALGAPAGRAAGPGAAPPPFVGAFDRRRRRSTRLLERAEFRARVPALDGHDAGRIPASCATNGTSPTPLAPSSGSTARTATLETALSHLYSTSGRCARILRAPWQDACSQSAEPYQGLGQYTVPAGLLLQVVELSKHWGVTPEELLAGESLEASELAEPQARLSFKTYLSVIARARALRASPASASAGGCGCASRPTATWDSRR